MQRTQGYYSNLAAPRRSYAGRSELTISREPAQFPHIQSKNKKGRPQAAFLVSLIIGGLNGCGGWI